MSDPDGQTPSDGDRKRKRDDEGLESADATPGLPDSKRLQTEESQPDPPPPPPPPSGGDTDGNPDGISNEQQEALRVQEEALIQENEEAERLEEQANETEYLEGKADAMQKEID